MKTYIASNTHHANKWRALKKAGKPIISTWIDYNDNDVIDYVKLWKDCVNEVKTCDYLIVYREGNDNLQGTLVEVGVAIGNGIPVLAVGEFERDWHNHELVIKFKSIKEAFAHIEKNGKNL